MKEVTSYSDGSSRGNPGPGGYGTIIVYVDENGARHEKEMSCGYLNTTNNRMELLGAIRGLEELRYPCICHMVTDSKYVTDPFNQNWIEGWQKKNWRGASGPVKNTDLWKRLLKAMQPHTVSWQWVKGHAGHPENERCDALAVAAALSGDLSVDEGMIV